ncbi:hypothetical protein [Streptacidiphilus monticola]|jgi:ABC-type transporter Mla subunit MlaD|uniref:Uncharacterized protein n=1 Tax=Streptacidiphilus monticola TaxID=2161674 RepID=A0ABW1G6Z1_9ACTN
MLLLGLLLAGGSAAFAGLLIAENIGGGPSYTVTMFGQDLGTVNTLGAFLAGLALALVFCLALAMIPASARRSWRRSHELRMARKANAGMPPRGAAVPVAEEPVAPAGHRRRGFHLLGHH